MNTDELGTLARNGLAWDLMGSVLRQVSTFVISIILARLLGPEQFGLIGIALVFTAVSQVFIDVGFTDGLIQRRGEVTNVAYSSIFYANFFISAVMAALTYLIAPFLGSFYESQELEGVMRALAIVLPIAAIGKVHAAMLVKRLNFRALAVRDILSTVIGGTIGIIAAINQQGVYSLVWQQISVVSVGTVLLWIGTRWKPHFVFSWREVKNLLSFSGYVFLDQVFRQIFQKLDTLFIGKFFSPATLGFYSRAESVNSQVTQYTASSLQRIIFPVFSVVQDDEDRFRAIYFKAFSLAAVTSSTLAGVLFFWGDKIILGLFGENWSPTIIIFQILVFRTLTTPFGALMGKCLLSKGLSRVKFKTSLLQRLIMLVPMIVGFFFSIEEFALMVVAASVVALFVHAFVLDRYLNISFLLQSKAFFMPLIPVLIVGIISSSFFTHVDSFLVGSFFLIVQWIFLAITHDTGYKFIRLELKGFLKRFVIIPYKSK